ncbi:MULTISPECIES: PaaI family thioesterase [unclassified Paraburkholderia]|uniref:PaaI family thioesterase n=1 Tax=unclassified Paraburkholderia TaxID=2615204 RepID=UPI0020B8BA88|nr:MULTISPECIES: PaaI family thioesterase [unclassified Paraburkholderia]MCP3716396.1 PaaI family thioesterase [Paraburkholderia sp. CNPSo 3281]MCX5539355.1 PaaI family thioesterase [Paraburkholderia sp. CNPSo 3076]
MEIEDNPALARLYGANGSPPITTTLGATFLSLSDDALEAEYEGAPSFRNPAGQVQGGMLCAMLDDVTATLVTSTLAEGEHCATLSLNTSFLRPAKPGKLTGRATLVRRGRGVCNVHGELWQEDKLIATATAVCMIVAR